MTLQSHGAMLGDDELAQEIRSLAPWFHNLHLPNGRQTAPDHPLGDFPAFKWEQIASHLPEDMSGLSVLDIGCNAGFYALQLAARGARVLGVDVDEHYLNQARWARARFGFSEDQFDLRRMQVYELVQLEKTFDIVLFMGVLYHLRYPLLALDIVAGRVGGRLILQTLTMPGDDVVEVPEDLPIQARAAMTEPGWPVMAFIERALAGDPTNWWAPNQACVEAMLRSAGLEPREHPGHEIVVAHRTSPPPGSDELQAIFGTAAGRPC